MPNDQEVARARLRLLNGIPKPDDPAVLAAAGGQQALHMVHPRRDLQGRVRVKDLVSGRTGWAELGPVEWDDEQRATAAGGAG